MRLILVAFLCSVGLLTHSTYAEGIREALNEYYDHSGEEPSYRHEVDVLSRSPDKLPPAAAESTLAYLLTFLEALREDEQCGQTCFTQPLQQPKVIRGRVARRLRRDIGAYLRDHAHGDRVLPLA